ncbi:hypothetical protein [Notoacmeibacter sp. MSK16QG-6]|uniref:hypothetical protein n=1 Tax=Notoacmeibacter sp. MSK16QG-6 TaxID=2957982 RepID=UPI00209E50A0|nr:hypothetical protein [Notoacmeibacter sp. MSK16QG-6]MCP1198970.1 hypothetical protein [Notoacmeibacter sp. MSK16QG-6]
MDLTDEDYETVGKMFVEDMSGYTDRKLDFSPESIWHLDALLQQCRNERINTKKRANFLMGFAIYLGEVIRINFEGRWITDEEDAPNDLFGPCLMERNGTFFSPISRVFKRVQIGPEESIVDYVQALTGQSIAQPQVFETISEQRRRGFFSRLFGK